MRKNTIFLCWSLNCIIWVKKKPFDRPFQNTFARIVCNLIQECIEERASQMGRRPPPSGEGLPPKPPTSNQPTVSNQSPSKISNTTTKSQSPAKVDKSSPSRPPSSPVRVGSATKTLQQRLIEKTQHSKTDQLAEKLRQERMAEVNALHNRYHNGILKEDLQWSEAEVWILPLIFANAACTYSFTKWVKLWLKLGHIDVSEYLPQTTYQIIMQIQ